MISHELYPTGDFMMTYWKISDIEKLLQISMSQFVHQSKGNIIHRSLDEYVIPSDISAHVDIFGMVNEFPGLFFFFCYLFFF